MAETSKEPIKVAMSGDSGMTATASVKANQSSLEKENENLAKENAALQQRLTLAQENAALAQENARLAEQNAVLAISQGGYGMPSPYGMYGAAYPPPPWAVDPSGYGMPAQYYGMPPPGMHPHQAERERKSSGSGGKDIRSMVQKARANAKLGNADAKSKASTASFGSTISGGSDVTSTFSSVMEDDENKKTTHEGPPTTVMMRNIPNNYTRELLLQLIEEKGFSGCYDLVYLPVDFKTEVGLGYSFINFTNPTDAERFRVNFEGFHEWSVLSEKVCEVSWSDALQGLSDHVERFRNSPVMHETVPDEFKPALFKDGARADFPPPTKKIRAPRPWSRRSGTDGSADVAGKKMQGRVAPVHEGGVGSWMSP